MNAKKIMGAVLVALLAVTAFAGVAAAEDPSDKGTIFAYTNLANAYGDITAFTEGAVFTVGEDSIAVVKNTANEFYFAATEDQLGKQYVGNGITFKLAAPTAVISALGPNGASIFGATITKEAAAALPFSVSSEIFNTANIVFIKDGVKYAAVDGKMPAAQANVAGKWGVAADLTNCANLTANAETLGQVYYFTIAKTSSTITAAQDSVIQGDNILITVTVPGATTATIIYGDKVNYFGQAGATPTTVDGKDAVKVNLTLAGTATVAFKAKETGKAIFELAGEDAEVTVTIAKGSITAVADEDFFYIGNPIYISGKTSTENLNFYIEGTNFDFMPLTVSGEDKMVKEWEVEDGKWTAEITSGNVKTSGEVQKRLIAGTYSIIVSNVAPDTTNYPETGYDTTKYGSLKEYVMSGIYGTAAVTLTQPFITDVEAAAVAVQGTDYKITGTAISAASVNIYIFGTNYFYAENVDTDEEVFEFEIAIPEKTGMAPGTYFYLIQHPMSDKVFNVWNDTGVDTAIAGFADELTTEGDFYYAATGAEIPTFAFNAWARGTNYAAQALLDEISGQNIDDIFVQGTFEVEAQKLTINPIPAEVVKGSKLAITGSTNSGEGVEVIVNVLAGKFGATVKGDENSATFLTAKAVTEEDGTFEAAIDTSKLELGSYIVTVEIAGTMYDSAAVEIVDKAPETPVDPVDPVDPKPVDPQPTEPETPGFGALAALAGLGAVAVLLLRRE